MIKEYEYNEDLGLETITDEYKLFTFNPILIDPEESLGLLKSQKWVFNETTIQSVKTYLRLYLPKYISSYTHPVTKISDGNLYIGVDDDGVIYGVPYAGEFPVEIIHKEVSNIFDTMVRVKNYSFPNPTCPISLESNNFDCIDIFDDIETDSKQETNTKSKANTDEKIISQYKKLTNIKILNIKKKNFKNNISTYEKYIQKLDELEKSNNKYIKKKEIWKNLILSYTNKLHDMLNDLDIREDIINFIKEKSNYSKKNFKNKYSDLYYLCDVRDYYDLMYELKSEYKYSSMKDKSIDDYKNNSTNIFYWVTRWKDSKTATIKYIKPKTPKYYSNKNYPMFLLSQVHQMIPEWCNSNTNLNLYLIKIKIPGNIDKSKVIEYYDGTNWIENYRKINLGSPTSVPIYNFF